MTAHNITAAELEKLLARLELDTDCDCDNEDCVRCAHYPTFVEQAQKQLRDMAPDLARKVIAADKLVEAATRLDDEYCGQIYGPALCSIESLRAALAAWEAAR